MSWFGFYFYFLSTLMRSNPNDKDLDLVFPDKFFFGVGTSAMQIEGAWNKSGKSENYWEYYNHKHPEVVADRSNADFTTDFYHKYKGDIQLIKDIGLDAFRFSISWARIFPSGYAKDPNEDGVRFYHDMLDELEKQGITPFATIYHWINHPQILENQMGGWLNESMVHIFADYAKFIFQEYGNRIKYFITINEIQILCEFSYITLEGNVTIQSNYYTCIHNMIKAHALTYRIYEKYFRSQQKGLIGTTVNCPYFYNIKKGDEHARDVALEYNCLIVVEPIYSKNGDYSHTIKKLVAERSRAQGLNQSMLPVFSKDWIEIVRGSFDFFGLNHYTSVPVESLPQSEISKWPNDEGLIYERFYPSTIYIPRKLRKLAPEGLKEVLRSIKHRYNNPLTYILESGVPDDNVINDDLRINYLYSCMKETLKAIKEDNCNVKGYFIWTLMDCFEGIRGYTEPYGIYHVDFKDENRKRTPKKSVNWLKSVIASRKLQTPSPILSGCDIIINNLTACL